MNNFEITRLMKKASQSKCNCRISAVAYDKHGEVLGYSTNKVRLSTARSYHGRGIHAESVLIKKYGKLIKTLVICRIGRSGILRPIDPCERCSALAQKLGITIKSIKD